MTSIETRIADAPLGGVKHSLRSATRGAEEVLEDEALMQEEEKMMDDEIFSDDDDSDEIEGRSSSEGPDGISKQRSGDADDDESSHHYGLRKRRRQSGSDLERLEMFQCSKAGGLAKSTKPKPAPAAKAVLSPASKAMPPPGARSNRKSKGGGQKALDFSDGRILNHKDISLVPNPLSDLEKVADSLFDDVVAPTDKRKVTISSQPTSGRKRGYSIDSLGGLSAAFSDDNSSHAAAVSDGAGRDRTFSFECFAFGINEDEPLPPLEATSAHMAAAADSHHIRPRGDSIIFDPVSFQDGGIHEQAAFLSIDDIPVLPAVTTRPITAKPPLFYQATIPYNYYWRSTTCLSCLSDIQRHYSSIVIACSASCKHCLVFDGALESRRTHRHLFTRSPSSEDCSLPGKETTPRLAQAHQVRLPKEARGFPSSYQGSLCQES